MTETTSCTCNCQSAQPATMPKPHWLEGVIDTPAGPVPRVRTRLTWRDRVGALRMRWGVGRGRYSVLPGLYAIGHPTSTDRVLVTSNYKLTVDHVRCVLTGRNLWLLVLDTKGINVWCAAGKGTFSAKEIADRIRLAGLEHVVSQRVLILPQLAAPGVAAHEVKAGSGFTVVYGPVRAADLPRFLDSGLKADATMRSVTFTLAERLRVVPVEIVFFTKYYLAYLAIALAGFIIFGRGGWAGFLALAVPPLGAFLAGAALVPILLPLLPMRSFVWQGLAVGAAWAAVVSFWLQAGFWQTLGNLLVLSIVSALCALNFTGATTFTSQSGVNREIARYARPLGLLAVAGGVCMVVGLFVQ